MRRSSTPPGERRHTLQAFGSGLTSYGKTDHRSPFFMVIFEWGEKKEISLYFKGKSKNEIPTLKMPLPSHSGTFDDVLDAHTDFIDAHTDWSAPE